MTIEFPVGDLYPSKRGVHSVVESGYIHLPMSADKRDPKGTTLTEFLRQRGWSPAGVASRPRNIRVMPLSGLAGSVESVGYPAGWRVVHYVTVREQGQHPYAAVPNDQKSKANTKPARRGRPNKSPKKDLLVRAIRELSAIGKLNGTRDQMTKAAECWCQEAGLGRHSFSNATFDRAKREALEDQEAPSS